MSAELGVAAILLLEDKDLRCVCEQYCQTTPEEIEIRGSIQKYKRILRNLDTLDEERCLEDYQNIVSAHRFFPSNKFKAWFSPYGYSNIKKLAAKIFTLAERLLERNYFEALKQLHIFEISSEKVIIKLRYIKYLNSDTIDRMKRFLNNLFVKTQNNPELLAFYTAFISSSKVKSRLKAPSCCCC